MYLFRRFSLIFMSALLLAACVENNPRYPAYYSYRVDVKVDGVPVTIERVIKCTGELISGSTLSPSSTYARTFLSPPIIGAYVPGTKEAVYTPTAGACRWAAATPEEREADAKKYVQFLERPFTEEHGSLKPDSLLPVLWVSNDQTFDEMEYYVSAPTLSGTGNRVEFIKVHPPEIVDEAAFEASESRAETESPDLTPFFRPDDLRLAQETKLYRDRFSGDYSGGVYPRCLAAWRVPRSEWAQVPGLEAWAADLPDDDRAYQIAKPLWSTFTASMRGIRMATGIFPIETEHYTGLDRFKTFDTISPAISTDEGTYVDLSRQGFMGCEFRLIQPRRVAAEQRFKVDRSTEPTASYHYELTGDRLYARFLPSLAPIFVPRLDEFIVFQSKSIKGTAGEPVVKGWKE
ncbi:hypothetical protein [Roseibium sp.]|uniref:hypothetical protein n=1 Tax=Roseibium sp. TaxID=1936156 RepID=UPI003A96DB41